MAITTRFFRTDEKQLMLDSIDRLWAHNHIYVRNPAVLEHLVLKTPYVKDFAGEGNYAYIGIFDDDKVIGLGGIIPQKANIFGKKVLSASATTWIIDPAYNGEGIRYWEFVFEKNPSMVDCIGLSDVAYKLYKAMGFSVMENLPRWIGVNRLEETVANLLPNDETKVFLPLVKKVETKSQYNIENQLNPEKWNKFYNEKFAPVTIGTVRDYEFLHWRYEESPVLKYNFIALTDNGGNYHGLAVVRIESIMGGKYKIGRVLDFIALESQAAVELGNAVIDFEKEVLMWDFYCLSDVTAFGLECMGFRQIPEWMDKVMMPTRFQPVDYGHMKLNLSIWLSKDIKKKLQAVDTAKWYITKGDADQDRAN